MSALRSGLEAAASPILGINQRLDELTRICVDLYDKNRALTHAVETLSGALASVVEQEHLDAIDGLLGSLDDRDRELRLRAAAEQIDRLGSGALDDWLAEQERKRRSQPWIPPRGTPTRRTDVFAVQVDEDGRTWGQSTDGGFIP